MNSLSFFVCIPVLMMLALLLCHSRAAIRTVMVSGSLLLTLGATVLLFAYLQERETNSLPMLFTASTIWYEPLQIGYSVGVDAISVVMILLSSVIVLTGVFVSWNMEPLTKEYFMWYLLLTTGVFGFFIDRKSVV